MSNVSELVARRIAEWRQRDTGRRRGPIAGKKVFGTSVALLGAITLMLTLIVTQRDYQRGWSAGTVAQVSTISEPVPAVPERIRQAKQFADS